MTQCLDDKNPKDIRGNTPFDEAAIWGHSEVCKFIQEQNPKTIKEKTDRDLAINKKKTAFVDFLNGKKIRSYKTSCVNGLCLMIRVDKATKCGYWHAIKRKKNKKQGETEIDHCPNIFYN